MTDDEYKMAQDQLILCARLLQGFDFHAFLSKAEHAEAVGFLFMAPFEYQRGCTRLTHIKALASAGQKLVAALCELDDTIIREGART